MKPPATVADAMQQASAIEPVLYQRLQAVIHWLDNRQMQHMIYAWRMDVRLFDRLMERLTTKAQAEKLEWRILFKLQIAWIRDRELFDIFFNRLDQLDYQQMFILDSLWKVDRDLFWSMLDTGADFARIFEALNHFCEPNPQGYGWLKRDLGRVQ